MIFDQLLKHAQSLCFSVEHRKCNTTTKTHLRVFGILGQRLVDQFQGLRMLAIFDQTLNFNGFSAGLCWLSERRKGHQRAQANCRNQAIESKRRVRNSMCLHGVS
ncbi:MAG: hypothetical protein U5L74_09430 [Ideonella sp.]|nr:hypothetical protein [Ideonella sp.]